MQAAEIRSEIMIIQDPRWFFMAGGFGCDKLVLYGIRELV